MKKFLTILLAVVCIFTLAACSKPKGEKEKEDTANDTPTYTVTWKNYNGDVLENDAEVEQGATPTYNGATPTKPANGGIVYIFAGWTPAVVAVTQDATYTATFTERDTTQGVPGETPVFSQDGTTVLYGYYPQTHVGEEEVITQLQTLSPDANGWYCLGGNYYTKQTATVYNNESYTFDDGTPIVNGDEYWFKCEPIEWKVVCVNNGEYMLIATKLLDASNYYANYVNRTEGNTIYANNYQYSDVREWLNGYFFGKAFAFGSDYVAQTNVDNSALTAEATTNTFVCGITMDKVYLPSYQDCVNADFGFDSTAGTSATRQCATTDYARARGAWCNDNKMGSYWTRTPSGKFYYSAWNVNSGGVLSEYAVDGVSHSVRPCISLTFTK